VTNRFVFIGDSITDAGRLQDPDGLGDGYVRLIARTLGSGAEIVNTGVSGDRIGDLAGRWSRDALEPEPTLLTVYVGINDTWRRYDSGDATTAERFETVYSGLLDIAQDAGIERLVLVEPFLLPLDQSQSAWLEDLEGKQAAVRRLAHMHQAVLVPLHEPFRLAALSDRPEALAGDGVHPSPAGSRLIADAWLEATEHIRD
jgi:lysophospholipase L1-like esterase